MKMSETLASLLVSRPDAAVIPWLSSAWFGGGAESVTGEAPASNILETDRSRPLVLVVDDAPDVVEMLAMLLRHSGYQVVTAASAYAALNAAHDERFDVVVSDIGMPGMNGYELAEALRALPDYSAIPMIALTGFALLENRDRALRSGFSAFLSKPIEPMALIELIEQLRD